MGTHQRRSPVDMADQYWKVESTVGEMMNRIVGPWEQSDQPDIRLAGRLIRAQLEKGGAGAYYAEMAPLAPDVLLSARCLLDSIEQTARITNAMIGTYLRGMEELQRKERE